MIMMLLGMCKNGARVILTLFFRDSRECLLVKYAFFFHFKLGHFMDHKEKKKIENLRVAGPNAAGIYG